MKRKALLWTGISVLVFGALLFMISVLLTDLRRPNVVYEEHEPLSEDHYYTTADIGRVGEGGGTVIIWYTGTSWSTSISDARICIWNSTGEIVWEKPPESVGDFARIEIDDPGEYNVVASSIDTWVGLDVLFVGRYTPYAIPTGCCCAPSFIGIAGIAIMTYLILLIKDGRERTK